MQWRYLRLGWWWGCAIAYFWFFAATTLAAWQHPFLNWDMVNYMGVAESYSTSDPQKIYDATMAEARLVYQPGAYDDLTQKNALSNSAAHFYQQLPICAVKPLYTVGTWALHAIGMPMAQATWTLTVTGFIGLGVVCYLFVPSGLDAGVWWLAILLFCAFGPYPMPAMARLSTPDTLCVALCLAAYCLWIYRRSFIGFAAFGLLAQLARPDALLLLCGLALFFTFFTENHARIPWRKGVGFIAAATILCLMVAYVAHSYGWKTLFYYSFIHKSGHPADIVPRFGWSQYIAVLHYEAKQILANARLQLMLVISAISIVCRYVFPAQKQRKFIELMGVVWLVFVVRFALYPAGQEDRYYYPYYFIMLYAAAEAVAACLPQLAARGLQYYKIATNTVPL